MEVRHRLVEGYRMGLVAEAGLIAHGRGEAFDYLLGERTLREAREAEEAAVAALLLAEKPVISVNGNVAALSSGEIVRLADALDARIEVNLFYRTKKREKLIANALKYAGAGRVYGLTKRYKIPGLGSERRNVDRALWEADTVLLALEDGDRTEALKRMGKKVIAVDLNPLSRTAQKADITIVDNLVRAYPNMIEHAKALRKRKPAELDRIIRRFDNKRNLRRVERRIRAAIL